MRNRRGASQDATERTDAASAAAAADSAPSKLIEQAGQLRFTSVESLRAIGALGVVMAHVYGAGAATFTATFEDRLASGVGFGALFFFSLTGCLLYLPFAKRDFGSGRDISLRQYGINRALRIFPLYYVVLIVGVLFVKEGISFEVFARWALFLENFYPDDILAINGVMWTAVVELHYYLLLPLIAWVVGRLAGGSIRRAALLVFGLGAASFALYWAYWLNPEHGDGNSYLYFSLPGFFFLVAAGMLVSLLIVHWRENGPPKWARGALASSDVWIFSAVPLWFLVIVDFDLIVLLAPAGFLVLAGCLLPLGGRRIAVGILQWRWIAVLGLGAYSLYLWHVPVIDVITDGATNSLSDDYWVLMAISLPLSVVVALISYRLIEEPALRLRRRWLGRIETVRPDHTSSSAPDAPPAATTPTPSPGGPGPSS